MHEFKRDRLNPCRAFSFGLVVDHQGPSVDFIELSMVLAHDVLITQFFGLGLRPNQRCRHLARLQGLQFARLLSPLVGTQH